VARAPRPGWLEAPARLRAGGGVRAGGGGGGRVHLWDVDSLREPVWSLDCWTGPVAALAFSADGRFLLCAGANAHLQLVDLSSRATILRATAGEYCGGGRRAQGNGAAPPHDPRAPRAPRGGAPAAR